ncbi:DUF6245 family protein [Kitasatospora sp. NPDC057542]|uniref:DUF6245 family protein n=1 Tax=Streptomycetaceae TaxID=2062 RepID=UPI001CC8FEDB|nr:DUF6245 family protein [Streptomyces sp. LS1784]
MTNDHTPVTVEQISKALTALGYFDHEITPAEHAEFAALNNHPDIYRVRMVNALLGFAQREAMFADGVELDEENQFAAVGEQMKAAEAWDDMILQMAFTGWQIARAMMPLRIYAPLEESGPLPMAAVQAAEGLHVMLGALGGTYAASAAGDIEGIAFQLEMQRAARGLLQTAIDNIDSVLDAAEAANNQ